ncbi:cobalamin-binding protein [Cyanobacterium stanieri LEGE 03274]|uniref:Cobalamin-binding protein n=1 Tax=Cyanobacterium stanieri LEGE 03274 TaxID=1828756 RepID=A0ABR9V065_9CHRO|nr:cobalamin-binding protein [Cyanobacterium stanieri]MBE9221278.1 cobalamin-binding protein [Cyanobacterium stanieri LEGE 03274]
MDKRIISLLPSATEIIEVLGLIGSLVGRSHECDYPMEVGKLPICTIARLNSQKPSREIDSDVQSLLQSAVSIYELKTDVIEQLQPTHIVTQDQCDVCAVSFLDVERAVTSLISSQPQIISLQPNLLKEVWADIERVARILDVPCETTLQQLQARVQKIVSQTETLSEDNRPTVVALEWTEPLMGGGNWIPELIEMAGGKPLLGKKGEHSPYLTWDALSQADPEVIIIMPCGFDLERTRQESQVLMKHPNWSNLQAVKQGKVFITDGNAYFNRPGPRLVDSLEILAEILHPDSFNFGHQEKVWQLLG